MYIPDHFREGDAEEISRLMAAHPLAALVTMSPNGLEANHIPILADGPQRLIGHIALNNDMHRNVAEGADVMVIFGGQNSYISPNWYPTKAENHKSVPTWNYQAVHVHGQISFRHDEKFKRGVVGRLTTLFERSLNGDKAWRMADSPADYMETMLANIVGFEIAITRIEAKSKLSQNRETVDFDSVADRMSASEKTELLDRMRRLKR